MMVEGESAMKRKNSKAAKKVVVSHQFSVPLSPTRSQAKISADLAHLSEPESPEFVKQNHKGRSFRLDNNIKDTGFKLTKIESGSRSTLAHGAKLERFPQPVFEAMQIKVMPILRQDSDEPLSHEEMLNPWPKTKLE